MGQLELRRLGGEEKRNLDKLAQQARQRVPLFNGGTNGVEAPVHTRREFFQTASGLVVVSFLPVWSLRSTGCADPATLVGLLITLFDVAKQLFNLGDADDPIRGNMGFDNRTGGPLNLEVLLDLLDIDRNSVPDTKKSLIQMAIDEASTYEWKGLEAKNEGGHRSEVTALGESDQSGTFQVKKVG